MKRRNFLKGSGIVLASSSAAAKQPPTEAANWVAAAPMPISAQELYPTVHQGHLYVAGGIAARLKVPYFTNRCFSFDPAANSWREEPALPEDRHHAALVSTGERLFLVGGFNGAYSHIWRMRNTIYELVDQVWQLVSELPTPRAEGVVAAAPDASIHIVTGQTPRAKNNRKRADHKEVATHLRWQPEDDRWQTLAPIPTPRNSATGGWVAGQLIVAGGRTSQGNLSATEIYSPDTQSWRQVAPMPTPQAGAASVVLGDKLVVFGGEIFSPKAGVFDDVWYYSITADKWQALPRMRTPRHGVGAGLFGTTAYVVGGATRPSGKGTTAINEAISLAHLVSG